jgi:membrane fusion protein, multidrug efflux system
MRKLLVLGFAASLVIAGLCVWLVSDHDRVNAAAPSAAPPAVPVTAAPVNTQDVPVYLRGLGTVQAFNTVEIKAQVNGLLVSLPAKEGQEVKPGDIVALIDQRPYKAALDQATAQRAEDVAQLQSAKLDLARYQDLAKKGFAPVQQVDDQQAQVNKLTAAVQADTAAIETAQINLDYCVIRSPISGRVSLYQTDVGNLIEVASQTGIVSITQDKPIALVFTLPESDLPRIQDAMAKGTLPVVAYTNDDKTKLGDGTLLAPNNTIDTTTGTAQLKATFPNDNDRLWPGEFVNARLLVETLHNATTVPLAAIQHGPNGLYVYTVGTNDTVQTHAVEVGYQDTTTAVVTQGLQAGQTVVVAGQSRLSPGTQVTTNTGNPSSTGGTGSTAKTPAPATTASR